MAGGVAPDAISHTGGSQQSAEVPAGDQRGQRDRTEAEGGTTAEQQHTEVSSPACPVTPWE